MDQAITGFLQDDEGDWIAELACGHRQHVRHRPPLDPRPWVLDATQRAARIGTSLRCRLCEQLELPEGLAMARLGGPWTQDSVPVGLLKEHRLGSATWGRLHVISGHLELHLAASPPRQLRLGPGESQVIPPGMIHELRLDGPVELQLEFLAVRRGAAPEPDDDATSPRPPLS